MSKTPFAPEVLKHVFRDFEFYRHKYFFRRKNCDCNFLRLIATIFIIPHNMDIEPPKSSHRIGHYHLSN
jgi:hypothetical protein